MSKTMRWTHETTVSYVVGPEGGQDDVEVGVRLYVQGTPATSDYFDRSFGNWLPGDAAEIELLSFEILERASCSCCKGTGISPFALPGEQRPCILCHGRGVSHDPRRPVPALYPDSFDDAVIQAVEACDHADTCWDSLGDPNDDGDARYDAWKDRQMEQRA